MRKCILGLSVCLIALACRNDLKSGQNPGNTSTGKPVEPQQSKATLTLNKGVRWQADSSTNKNVRLLLAIVQKFNADPDKSVKAYNNIAKDMEEALNSMIRECKMSGSGHDALHQWLEPLVEKVSELKKTSKNAEEAQLWAAIQNQVILYTRYFE